MASKYVEITPNGFKYAELRIGVALQSPCGKDIYFQPGDDTAAILETIEALEEIEDLELRAHCANVALDEYFSN